MKTTMTLDAVELCVIFFTFEETALPATFVVLAFRLLCVCVCVCIYVCISIVQLENARQIFRGIVQLQFYRCHNIKCLCS